MKQHSVQMPRVKMNTPCALSLDLDPCPSKFFVEKICSLVKSPGHRAKNHYVNSP